MRNMEGERCGTGPARIGVEVKDGNGKASSAANGEKE